MPDVAQVLKAEIRRVARSEIKGQIAAVKGQVKALKKTVRMQRETIAKLEKALTTPMSSPRSVQTADDGKTARITPASVKLHRLRLKLSQRQLGQLLGVSTNTIVRWEAGCCVARPVTQLVAPWMSSSVPVVGTVPFPARPMCGTPERVDDGVSGDDKESS